MAAMAMSEEFGEAIIYEPAGQPVVAIQAQVFRTPLNVELYGDGTWTQDMVELVIANHATLGRSSIALDQDRVSLRMHVSDPAPRWFRVCKIINQDLGAWHLLAKA